jgi:hypothetical protein
MQSTDIPAKIQLPFAAGAGGSYVRAVPVPSQIGITPGAASYTDGFPPINWQAIALGGVPPFGQDVNGILNAISAWSRWLCSGAPIIWDAAFSTAIGGYPKGAIVQSAVVFGTIWVSIVENNTTDPDAAGAGWVTFNEFIGLAQSQIIALIEANAPPSLGVGQSWVDVTSSRAHDVVYTNSTGKPIQVAISGVTAGSVNPEFRVDGVPAPKLPTADADVTIGTVIPSGSTYQLFHGGVPLIQLSGWSELR